MQLISSIWRYLASNNVCLCACVGTHTPLWRSSCSSVGLGRDSGRRLRTRVDRSLHLSSSSHPRGQSLEKQTHTNTQRQSQTLATCRSGVSEWVGWALLPCLYQVVWCGSSRSSGCVRGHGVSSESCCTSAGETERTRRNLAPSDLQRNRAVTPPLKDSRSGGGRGGKGRGGRGRGGKMRERWRKQEGGVKECWRRVDEKV